MVKLPELTCPSCGRSISAVDFPEKVPAARSYATCLRHCASCGIGASNSSRKGAATYIYQNPLNNIPYQSRDGAEQVLAAALNVRNRPSKLQRFGFSTSEDAITWVVFNFLAQTGQLRSALERSDLIKIRMIRTPTLLLWGSPIGDSEPGRRIQKELIDFCTSAHENSNSYSEPDVIVDFAEDGVVVIEVKYRSANERKSLN